jgi:DNA-directed RNA polymerase specialized sigma24 family protein
LFFPGAAGIVRAVVHPPLTGISMPATLTQFDRMLYEWLAETDDRRFDLAFNRYYAAASTHLVRYLSRRSRLADLDCEQIAVDALLKFFGRVGRDRRLAAEAVSTALPRIEPLDLGPFHVRQVHRWTAEIGTFRHASMTFTVTGETAESWKGQIQALAESIPPLQRQGCHLLESAKVACHSIAAVADSARDAHDSGADDAVSSEYAVIREFALSVRKAVQAADAMNPELRQLGFIGFVDDSWTVVEALPLLRVPTNGYLFDIAQSLYLDECKARGRRKRGGSGFDANGTHRGREASAAPAPSPLKYTGWPDEEGDGARSGVLATGFPGTDLSVDPVLEQIDEDSCEQFYKHLRKPVEESETAYQEVTARGGRGEAERKRLESIAKKNERLMTVLAMRIEGRTQEEIAENLEISRNQVKYIVELVQSAYEQFCATAACTRKP